MIVVLANPASSGFTGAALRQVLSVLGPDAEAHWPEHPDETMSMAKEAAERGATVVAMGGDGMVHHVVRGLVGSTSPLGIVPVGTTNVVARLFGLPSQPSAAAERIADGTVDEVPLAVARWVDARGDERVRPVVFSLGIGWDAEVVASAEREPYRKATGGVRLYARQTAIQLRKEVGRLADLTVSADDPSIAGRAMALQVQLRDAYTFAGPRRIRLGPPPTTGMRVATWRRLRGREVLPLAAAAATEDGAGRRPDVDTAEVAAVSVVADHDVRLQIDGEPLGTLTELEVTLDPGGLRIIT